MASEVKKNSFGSRITDLFFGGRRQTSPSKPSGLPGTAIYQGFLSDEEINNQLRRAQIYKTYANILSSCTTVSASLIYFQNLIGAANWTFEPSEEDKSGEYADMFEKMLTEDCYTDFRTVNMQLSMAAYYGFAVLELITRRDMETGRITLNDVQQRPQHTIYRWDRDDMNYIHGVTQRSPQDYKEYYIPRSKMVYIVDNSIHDSPEGLGLMRTIAPDALRLLYYERLMTSSMETDLRGIPIIRAPFEELQKLKEGDPVKYSDTQIDRALGGLKAFARNFITGASKATAINLDSVTYQATDEKNTPTQVKKYDLELLQGSANGQAEMIEMMRDLKKDIARVLGTESLFVGDNSGSYALVKEKVGQFSLKVEKQLKANAEVLERDLLRRLAMLNGIDLNLVPRLVPEAVRSTDVSQTADVILKLAQAGIPLMPSDPAVNELRAEAGLSGIPEELLKMLELDASLMNDPEEE